MAGRLELGFPNNSSISDLREEAARKILRSVRSQGHPYVELRENGRKSIFFCILCLKECYSDDVLYQHLNGSFHRNRLASANITLMGPNPWPFNDGLVFFDTSAEDDKDLGVRDASQNRLLKSSDSDSGSCLAIVKVDEAVPTDVQPSSADDDCALVIRDLMIGEETFDVKVMDVGLGKIAARFIEKNNMLGGIRRIWCEWLGKENNGQQDDDDKVPEHDYALVIFSHNSDLGRLFEEEELKPSPPTGYLTDPQSEEDSGRKRKKLLPGPAGVGSSSRNQKDSSPENSLTSKVSTSRLALKKPDNHLLLTRLIAKKAARKELRRQKRLAAEKLCNICQQKMLHGKDVAALLNLKTGRLVCNTRNEIGAFHVFHMSCALHWILICESSIITNRLAVPNVRLGVKRKTVDSGSKTGKGNEIEAAKPLIKSVFCPECQGTGTATDETTVEYPPFSLSEMFNMRIKAVQGRREWLTSPEVLQNCSVGFHFPAESEEEMIQEKVEPIKLLRFYRADLLDEAKE